MTHNNQDTSDVRFLVESVCDGTADNAQIRELESQLLNDTKACEFYLDLLNIDAELQWLASSREQGEMAIKRLIAAETQPVRAPLFGSVYGLSHVTTGIFASDWPLAYLIATVIFGLGALVGAITYVSQPVQVARQSATRPSLLTPHSPSDIEFVGRITGMVDCQWADTSTAVVNGANVPFGQKYSLRSGLMEITYNTGAKVIIQGPVTYEFESKNGGFLSLGKLTGKVEVEKAKGFVVRTPTATVTDLGTEFGIEVTKDGLSEVHVFDGVIETKFMGEEHPVRLIAGEAVRMGSTRSIAQHMAAVPSNYVRAIARSDNKNLGLIVADNFNYPDGPLEQSNGGISGPSGEWSGRWFRDGTVSNGQVMMPSISVGTRLIRIPQTNPPKPIYFSARFMKTGNDDKYALFMRLAASVNDDNDDYDDATIGLADGQYTVRLGNRVRDDFGSYKPGTEVLIVGKLEFNVDGDKERLQMWVDPTGHETATIVSSPILSNTDWSIPSYLHLRNWVANDGSCTFDDVRIGYTWESVVGANLSATSKEDSPMKH